MFVLGVAYLLLAVLINIFKRSELEKWFAQSRHDQDKKLGVRAIKQKAAREQAALSLVCSLRLCYCTARVMSILWCPSISGTRNGEPQGSISTSSSRIVSACSPDNTFVFTAML